MKGISWSNFKWSDLDGKTLKIKVGEDVGDVIKITSVMGQDVETGEQYLLISETEKVTP